MEVWYILSDILNNVKLFLTILKHLVQVSMGDQISGQTSHEYYSTIK